MKYKIILILFLCPILSFSKTLSFLDNQMLPVSLSHNNINRLVMENDQITHIICPQGSCVSRHNSHDDSGSVYVELTSKDKFTLYIATAHDHHAGLLVSPVLSDGKTIVLNAMAGNPKAAHWEIESSYQATLIHLLRAMMTGVIPNAYGFHPIINAPKEKILSSSASLQAKAMWTGNHLVGVEYLLSNTSKNPLILFEHHFYHQGVRLVALTQHRLLPKESEEVYEILSRN